MANSLIKFIPATFIYTAIIVALINFILLEYLPTPLPGLILFVIYGFVFFGLYGYGTSNYAATSKCNKSNKKRSTKHAFYSAIVACVTYVLIYFVKFMRDPFNEIFGSGNLSTYLAETFYISLNLTLLTLSNTYESAKLTCQLKPDEIKKNLKKLDKYLRKKFKKKSGKRIIVKD